MKKIIIHTVNGDEYHIWEGWNFDNNKSYSLDKFLEYLANMPIRFIKISREDGYGIKCVSRFSTNALEEMSIRVETISSIDLLELEGD